ncbi:DUF2062 domain-containing protein [Sphingomonas pokkalii]|uniref:DUF2062 domain-containing protein n=1 Tax=Sphingomonas pokkalii TaxID=2175090 RepID=A0A2U0SD41_9SPHN|nr:DUF2062 domain-containing protein [Sphingomonas pokkalii]PVX29240.1 DUF2062 domain-containing protein [Sphingomonas pokkalii]
MPRHRVRRMVNKAMPSRDSIENNRWLRPVASRVMHSSLWRFTRRSVPRGVALGMVTGILVPMGQIPASAVLALPLRANIPAAAATTFFTNPFTTPPLWIAAYWLGSWMLGPGGAKEVVEATPGWVDWLLHDAGPATATGLVTITVALAVLGYFGSALLWRLWIAGKWRRRKAARAEASATR